MKGEKIQKILWWQNKGLEKRKRYLEIKKNDKQQIRKKEVKERKGVSQKRMRSNDEREKGRKKWGKGKRVKKKK